MPLNSLSPSCVLQTKALRKVSLSALIGVLMLAAGCGGGSNDGFMTPIPAATWVGTWATSPTGPADLGAVAPFVPSITLENVTLRMIVRSSIAGGKVRVRLSNEIGDAPTTVQIRSAHIGVRAQGNTIVGGTDRALKFAGQGTITIPGKGSVTSDPVDLEVGALTDLAVSIYLPQRAVVQSAHFVTRQTQYVVTGSDVTSANSLPPSATTMASWYLLSGIDVTPRVAGAASFIVLGDSITDGFGQSSLRVDAPAPWPAWPSRLAERLQAADASLTRLAVLNEGISGNRILNDAAQTVPPTAAGLTPLAIYGPKATARFDRDVTGQSGVSCVMIFEGINDIGQGAARQQVVSADQIIAGYQQLIAKARTAGLGVLGATLTPFSGYAGTGYDSAENETKRQTVNTWIRSSSQYDAVVDFDAMMRDPGNPSRLLPVYDSGDHLHPSDAGYKVMADGVDLPTLSRLCPQKNR